MAKNMNTVLVSAGLIVVVAASLYGGFRFAARDNAVDKKFKEVADNTRNAVNDNFGVELPEYEDLKDIGSLSDDDYEDYDYSYPKKSSYKGPVINRSGSYMFNSEGKVVTMFADAGYGYVNLSTDMDHSEAVVVQNKDEILYYFDSDLNMTKISDNIREARMCDDGRYAYYLTEYNNTGKSDLYIYDTKKGQSKLIASEVNEHIAISPDGETLAFCTRVQGEGYVCKIMKTDGTLIDSITGLEYSPNLKTVSNDGKALFYETYFPTGYMCHTPDGEAKLTGDYVNDCFWDRDCKQMLFESDDAIWYFHAGDKKPSLVLEADYSEFNICSNVSRKSLDPYFAKYILDTDSFSDAITFFTSDESYALTGKRPKAVKMISEHHSDYVAITEDGPACIYSDDDYILHKTVFDGEEMTTEPLLEGDYTAAYFVCSDDLSECWFFERGSKSLYYLKEGQEPVKLKTFKNTVYTMKWNPYDGKCYYIYDDTLYRVADNEASDELFMENAMYFPYSSEIPKPLMVCLKDSTYIAIIADERYVYEY